MRDQFPSNSRELPVFPDVLGDMSISRFFANRAKKWSFSKAADVITVLQTSKDKRGNDGIIFCIDTQPNLAPRL